MDKDIRWKQRFQNFEKMLGHMEDAGKITNYTKAHKAGLIHFFEIAFELGWETIKDYLNEGGYNVKTPRESIKLAFQSGIIENENTWMEMLNVRKELIHLYDDTMVEIAFKKISNKFLPSLVLLFQYFKNKIA